MAATQYAVFATYQSYATSAPFLASAFTDNESLADLLQIEVPGKGVVLAVQNNGTVNFNANGLTPTNGASASASYTVNRQLVGLFRTNPTATVTTVAQAVAAAFPLNPQSWDIIQVIQEGGNVGYYLDSVGVAHGS